MSSAPEKVAAMWALKVHRKNRQFLAKIPLLVFKYEVCVNLGKTWYMTWEKKTTNLVMIELNSN